MTAPLGQPGLDARVARTPRPFDPARGEATLAAVPGVGAALRPLLAGAAGSSPHLAGLMAAEGTWLAPALADPEGALDAALAEAAAAQPVGPALRRAKRRVALLTALMDLGGAWPLETVTGALTRLADLAVDRALKVLVAEAVARGRLPRLAPGDAETAGGLVALAMGKMGAHELNYSSDIDLVCLFDEARFSRADFPAARAGFVRVVRGMTALLSDRAPDGYVFRVDLRLRPDAAVTPVAMAMAGAEAYYESLGRTWERAAFIKARAAGGDLGAGERFLETLRPFVWRRHLDFAAIQDAHDMRLRIRDHKGLGGPFSLDGHDLKLGRGGIREVEFFTQTRQLIAGGRDPSLRVRGTVEGLARLAAAGWVPPDVAATLTRHYRRLREVEHRLQMIADTQTHVLPALPEGWARLAALMGEDLPALRADLAERLAEVHELTEGFFAPGPGPTPAHAPFGAEVVARWPSYPALRSTRAVEIFGRLKPVILSRLGEAARPEEALAAFDGFLAGLPAGVQLFSLFEANPDLLRLLADVCATAPALARYLARNAGVLDAVIGGDFFAPWPGEAGLGAGFAGALAEAGGYEARLDAARRWMKDWWFRVGVHHLRGLVDADEAGRQYADLAGAVLAGLLPVVEEEFAARHGPPPGRGAVVLGMGSLGAGRLTASSDLDLIVIYDAAEASAGLRPLVPRAYYARLAQALVTALAAPMSQGRLYQVDMRLRPSGRQGPVATSLAAFQAYQREEAWTWEHLALTRARVVAGPPALAAEVEALREELVTGRRGDGRVMPDLGQMRARLAAARAGEVWNPKDGPGRLRDVELAAQGLALVAGSPARTTAGQIEAGAAAGLVTAAEAATLGRAAALFGAMQAAARLLTEGPLDPSAVGEGGRRMLLREAGEPDLTALAARLEAEAGGAAAIIGRLAP